MTYVLLFLISIDHCDLHKTGRTMKLLALGGLFLSTASAFLIPTTPQVPGARTATNTGRIATLTPAGPSTLPQTAMASTAAPAATTSFVGSTLNDMDLAHEALAKFFPADKLDGVEFKQTSGGVNNIGMYVTFPDGRKYVMRIYNNSNNRERVQWEHEILRQLNAQKLSFHLPKPLPSLADPTLTYAPLSSTAADACMFELIPGALPKLTCVEDIGRASGELLEAIQKVDVGALKCPTPPYHDLYAVHHAVDSESFFREMAGPDFDHIRPAANKAIEYIKDMEQKIEKFRASKLPECLIHGDLHYDNVLVQDGKVTGLLDFEFSAIDYRAMELAVCLSKYAGEPQAMQYFNDFITGFVQHGRLTPREIEVVPDLINLRILSNVIYFVGRALSKEDDISSLTTRLENYNKRVEWVNSSAQAIRDSITTKLAAATK